MHPDPIPTRPVSRTAGPRRARWSTRSPLARHVALAVLVVLGVAGCAAPQRFSVEAAQRSALAGTQLSYRLVDARPESQRDRRLFERVSHDVAAALSSRGLFPAPEGVPAALVVEVDYGISAPVVTEAVRREPVYVVMPATGSDGLPGSSLRAATPQLRYLGSEEIIYHRTSYHKFLRLTAREATPTGPGAPVREAWSVRVTNEDRSDDLARYTRLMVAAAMDHIGTDQPGERHIVLKPDDPRVRFVARGLGR